MLAQDAARRDSRSAPGADLLPDKLQAPHRAEIAGSRRRPGSIGPGYRDGRRRAGRARRPSVAPPAWPGRRQETARAPDAAALAHGGHSFGPFPDRPPSVGHDLTWLTCLYLTPAASPSHSARSPDNSHRGSWRSCTNSRSGCGGCTGYTGLASRRQDIGSL